MHQKSEGVRALLVADLSGGVTRELLREPGVAGGTLFNTLEWAPDQRSLLYVRENELGQTVWRIPIDGGEPVNLGVTMRATIKGPQLHPDGKTLFFTVHKEHFEVWALSNFLPPGK